MPIESTTLLALSNLHKSFGAFEVLRDINLTMEEGEVVALIGARTDVESFVVVVRRTDLGARS